MRKKRDRVCAPVQTYIIFVSAVSDSNFKTREGCWLARNFANPVRSNFYQMWVNQLKPHRSVADKSAKIFKGNFNIKSFKQVKNFIKINKSRVGSFVIMMFRNLDLCSSLLLYFFNFKFQTIYTMNYFKLMTLKNFNFVPLNSKINIFFSTETWKLEIIFKILPKNRKSASSSRYIYPRRRDNTRVTSFSSNFLKRKTSTQVCACA